MKPRHKQLRDIELSGMSDPLDPEAEPSGSPSSPLLPTYSPPRADSGLPHPSATSSYAQPSPYAASQARRERRRLATCFRLVRCCVVLLLIVVPSLGWAACYGADKALEALKEWRLGQGDQIPEEWKGWLEGLVGSLKGGVEGSAEVDPGFPTDVGYAGPTPSGSEPFLLATAPSPPMHTHVSPLLPPSPLLSSSSGSSYSSSSKFSIIQHWGHLSPYFSVTSHGLPESTSLIPDGCELERVVWLQRHGARYPTTDAGDGGPAGFGRRLQRARLSAGGRGWEAKGAMKWLNEWEYKLGAEVLTPFGRQQLFNLGTAARIKYGHLLDKMDGRKPVFRTESQDRMLKSAQNFAAGFFGIPAEDQYHLEVTIEAAGFNNTLAPWSSCYDDSGSGRIAAQKSDEWISIFLADALPRLQGMIDGFELTLWDVKAMMDTCAYETVALGYSAFCDLFTRKEWRGYEYSMDLWWWYSSAFGYPKARAQGKGWTEELIARLTRTRITQYGSTVNSTLNNELQFPLDDVLMVDFTHDVQFAMLLPTLNLSSFARTGPPPTDHIPKKRSFISSQFTPFATNLQFQVLSCASSASSPFGEQQGDATAEKEDKIRLILNDAPVPLTGIPGCPEDKDGMCGLEEYVQGLREVIGEVDWAEECADKSAPSDAVADEEGEGTGDGEEVEEEEAGMEDETTAEITADEADEV